MSQRKFLRGIVIIFYFLHLSPTIAQDKFMNNEDSLASGDWWNKFNSIIDLNIPRDSVIGFCLYTASNNTLRLTAQFYPLYPNESRSARLYLKENNLWSFTQSATITEAGWFSTFEVNGLSLSKNIEYKVEHDGGSVFYGLVRGDVSSKNEIIIAALSCNSSSGPKGRDEYVQAINSIDPDLIFFAGDQSYYHKQHTSAWLLFGKQFKEIFRNRPCITIPDDHDIGQPNLWGENGKTSFQSNARDGGYILDPRYVKMVEAAQTSHLPVADNTETLKNGLTTYYTSFLFGKIDIAILEDRKFKISPISAQNLVDTSEYLTILGDRQLNFLENWINNDLGAVNIMLSQTPFASTVNYGSNTKKTILKDKDSNGWPKKGRDEVIQLLSKVNVIHISGDTHLASVFQHGIVNYGDGPWSFTVPAIVNNYYQRWWWPDTTALFDNYSFTGNYLDAFVNKITMHAYGNPSSFANDASGFGIIRINSSDSSVIFECRNRFGNVNEAASQQLLGWPIKLSLLNGSYVRDESYLLPFEEVKYDNPLVFPNPFESKAQIYLSTEYHGKPMTIGIYDNSGKLVFTHFIKQSKNYNILDLKILQNQGIYIMKLEIDGDIFIDRLYKGAPDGGSN